MNRRMLSKEGELLKLMSMTPANSELETMYDSEHPYSRKRNRIACREVLLG